MTKNSCIKILALASFALLVGCQKESTQDVGPKLTTSKNQSKLADPEDPIIDCTTGNCPPVYVTPNPNFYSTEGTVGNSYDTSNSSGSYNGADNPNGYILDVKLTHGNGYDAFHSAPDGYTVIPLNLNYGAGGETVYFCFTRNPSKVVEVHGARGPITSLTILDDDNVYGHTALFLDYQDYIYWQTTFGWKVANLNSGAGGLSAQLAGAIQRSPQSRPIEFGIVHSQDPGVSPPAGWAKSSIDLNENVGGNCDFIWLCFKRR